MKKGDLVVWEYSSESQHRTRNREDGDIGIIMKTRGPLVYFNITVHWLRLNKTDGHNDKFLKKVSK